MKKKNLFLIFLSSLALCASVMASECTSSAVVPCAEDSMVLTAEEREFLKQYNGKLLEAQRPLINQLLTKREFDVRTKQI